MLFSQASFLGETSGVIVKNRLFLQATSHNFLCIFLSYINFDVANISFSPQIICEKHSCVSKLVT